MGRFYSKTIVSALLFGLMSLNINAQSFGISESDFARYGVSPQRVVTFDSLSWINTSNAASLGIFSLNSLGITQIGANHTDGNYKLAAQSGTITSLGFYSDSYRSLEKINLYGRFSFNQQWHSKRLWSDNFDPYNGTPYIVGGDIEGDYSKQIFDFSVKASSMLLWNRIWLGVGFDYKDGDFSRSRDPRSRSQLADYKVYPGIIVKLSSNSSIGMNIFYRYYKEKMLKPVSKAESYDKYTYYLQKGMGEYSATTILFFSRRYSNNYYGGNLQYNFANQSIELLVDGGVSLRNELVIDETRQIPGDFKSYDFNGSIDLSFKSGKALQKIKLKGIYSLGNAREYLQENVIYTNDQGRLDSYWRTIMKNSTYNNSFIDVTASWRFYRLNSDGYKWFAGACANYYSFGKKYLMPTSSANYSWLSVDLEYGSHLFTGQKSSINFIAECGALKSMDSELNLNNSLVKEKKSTINENVLLPDFDILSSDSFKIGAELNYIFKRDKSVSLFASAYTSFLIPININIEKSLRYCAGISLGIIFP